jgi:hypothetical protein
LRRSAMLLQGGETCCKWWPAMLHSVEGDASY